ncbi:FecR family protein [Novosphingobium terrae]|uniref:FecR family protein n=1 Tax=Novosphingobium terrae TaxID=2726189 RepID=UPI00197FE090|nr:FecR domain-containing protein [Novosphingobium terrae]
MNSPAQTRQEVADFWVARMDSGSMSADDEAQLQAWMEADSRNEGLLLRTRATWFSVNVGLDEKDVAPAALPEAAPIRQPLWQRRSVLAGAMAASVAGLIARFTLFDPGQSYSTRLGEIRRVPLADGSVMTMNSNTDLAVRLEEHARSVNLHQGEAWFEVAKDAQRPFVVTSGQVKARAVGTAFSVRRRDAGVEVLVTEGVVEAWSGSEQQRIRLAAGERLLMTDNARIHYGSDQKGDVERALAWRSGMIRLSGTTLADAADEFNRYNKRQLLVTDPEVAGEQMAGQFRFNDPEGFAIAVRNSFNLRVDMSNPAFIKIERAEKTAEI